MTELSPFFSEITLSRGLYLLRLIQVAPGGGLDKVSIWNMDGGGAGLAFFPGVGVSGQSLISPGQCLVVRVESPQGRLRVDYFVRHASVLQSYSVRVDRVDDSGLPAGPAERSPPVRPVRQNLSLSGEALTGELLTMGADGWLSVPDEGGLETLVIDWPEQPPGAELMIRPSVVKLGTLREVSLGREIGLRGRGLPLLGLELLLHGPLAAHYQLFAEARFAEWGRVESGPGTRLVLKEPALQKPLCALRISLIPMD